MRNTPISRMTLGAIALITLMGSIALTPIYAHANSKPAAERETKKTDTSRVIVAILTLFCAKIGRIIQKLITFYKFELINL